MKATGEVDTITVTRIRIDDESLCTAKGALFAVECVSPGTEFIGSISVLDADERSLALLLLALSEIRLGRFGRGSLIDIKVENYGDLEGSPWRH